MKFFARLNGGYAAWQGMSQETIVNMLTEQGLVPEFIDEATYLSEVAKQEKLRLEAKNKKELS
jgi:hypothetical protein